MAALRPSCAKGEALLGTLPYSAQPRARRTRAQAGRFAGCLRRPRRRELDVGAMCAVSEYDALRLALLHRVAFTHLPKQAKKEPAPASCPRACLPPPALRRRFLFSRPTWEGQWRPGPNGPSLAGRRRYSATRATTQQRPRRLDSQGFHRGARRRFTNPSHWVFTSKDEGRSASHVPQVTPQVPDTRRPAAPALPSVRRRPDQR
jgi:hypothetical protein